MTIWAWSWMVWVLLAVVAVCFTVRSRLHSNFSDTAEWLLLGGIVGSLATFVCGLILTCYQFGGAYEGRQCARYSQATGVTTTFKRWSFWTWDCYVDTDQGKITLGQYKAIEQIDRL